MKLQLTTSSATHKGQRPYQEDRLFTATMQEGTLLAVFDGHGGGEVSHLASEELPVMFADEITEDGAINHVDDVLRNVVQKLNIMTQDKEPGSTLSLAFIPAGKPVVYCAVMGDSPILIKDKDGKINISPDHNIRTNDAERRAAEDRGGFCDGGYLFASFDGMGLQMARALGDSHLNKVLSRLPDVYAVEINENSFVLVGTDGLFDPGHWNFKVEADAVVKLIDEGADAAALVTRAVNIPTGDNVTAILARFANE